MSTPTPRTNEAWQKWLKFGNSEYLKDASLTLETKLTAALARIAELDGYVAGWIEVHDKSKAEIDSLTRQLSEAQAQLEKQRLILVANQKIMDGAGDSIKALQTQLTSAREDSARLDWFERRADNVWLENNDWNVSASLSMDGTEPATIGTAKTFRSAIDSARGFQKNDWGLTVPTPPREAPVPASTTRWSYSSYRATLKLDGKSWAIVSPDGRNALSAADAALLERAMNSLDASLLPPPPTGKEKGCPYCLKFECECSDADVSADMGDK